MSKLLVGEALENACNKNGIDVLGDPVPISEMNGKARLRATDYELQTRLMSYKRHQREARLWMLAMISALASMASAIVAVIAVAGKI